MNNTGGFAALSYIMGTEKKDPTILFYIKKKFGDRADKLAAASERGGYGSALGAKPNFAGYDMFSNMTVISDCLICQTAYMLFGLQKYIDAASMALQYLMGKNPMGVTYITGVSEDSPERPRHSISYKCGESVPGMIVCGANYFRNDEFSRWRLGKHTPPAKCYIDNECSVSTNEPYISFSAAALMAFAFFDRNGSEQLPK